MGRKGSLLAPFLQKALNEKKYRNLTFEDESKLIFSINFRHKTKGICDEDEKICKDWFELKSKEYVSGSNHYTMAKQSLIASLKTSDYVENVPNSPNELTFRILSEDEVKEKKRLKKEPKKKDKVDTRTPRCDRGVNLPPNSCFVEPSNNRLLASDDKELSQGRSDIQANSLFLTNDIQKTASSTSSTLDGFVISEAKDVCLSAKNFVADPVATPLFQPLKNNLIAIGDKELSQGRYCLEANSLLQSNDIQQTDNSTSGTLDGFVMSENRDVSVSAENSVAVSDTAALFDTSNNSLIALVDKELSQNCYVLEANSLFQSNDIQQTGNSTSGALDGFVMSENRDVSVSAENSVAVSDTAALFDTSNNSLIALVDKELSQNCYVLEANSLFQSNDIQQTGNSTSGALDGFVMSENRDVSVSAENSVAVSDTAALFDTSNSSLIALVDKELSQNRYVLEANSLFQSNDIQQTVNSTSGTLDGFVMSETMNVRASERNYAAVPDTTALFEKDILNNIQPFAYNPTSTNYFLENPEYPTSGLDLTTCAPENPGLNCPDLVEDDPAENEGINIWDILEAADITNEELNILMNDIQDLNSNPSMASDDNLSNNASEMQNINGQHTEYQDLSAEKLREQISGRNVNN